ncbi:MAG: hypothetical protein JSS96_14155 [Bacteroidetes bacterium]|nr:hypothetical protein [Bacteroidota bacterium]
MTRKEQKHELLLTFLIALEKQADQKASPTSHRIITQSQMMQDEEDLNNSLNMLYFKARKLFEAAGKEKLYRIPTRIAARLRRRKLRRELVPLYS